MAESAKCLYDMRNQSTRIDLFEELTDQTTAALRAFTRRLGASHLFDEVLLPTLREGESQILAAVQDRPWPPWGLGARHLIAVCQTQSVGDASFAVSPVYATDEDLTNIGMISAVYKEALEQLAVDSRAEICYLVAEGSKMADQVLRANSFVRSEDVFVTWACRYYTYRAPVGAVLSKLGLDKLSTPDLLAHDFKDSDNATLLRNGLFHQTVYLGSRAEWMIERSVSELVRLPRGGHASKPGGVPSGTGRFVVDPVDWEVFVWMSNWLADGAAGDPVRRLVDHVLKNQKNFKPATVVKQGAMEPTVDERTRRALTFDDLGEFKSIMVEKIKANLDAVLKRMGRKGFQLGEIEMQIGASNDGDYFRLHPDTDGKDTREITFVYFFHHEPRRFSGGELRIYETREFDGKLLPADHAQTLSPRQDAIVFFPSMNEHEVLPVRVPSGEFGDSRFTITGWIHRR